MNKKVAIGLTAILATTSLTPAVHADGLPEEEHIKENVSQDVTEDEQASETKNEEASVSEDEGATDDEASEGEESTEEEGSEGEEDAEEPEEEPEEEPIIVDSLTLEEAIEYGLNNNYSFLRLENQLKNLKSQLEAAIDDHGLLLENYDDILDEIEDLEERFDDLREEQKQSTGQARRLIFQERLQIQETIKELEDTTLKTLEDQIDGALDGIESLKFQKNISKLTDAQTKESMKFQIASTYIQHFIQKEQIALQKETLKTQKQQVKNLERQYEIGVISRNEVDTAKREIVSLETQIQDAEESLQKDLALFTLDLGIAYHPDLTLIASDLSQLQLIEQETETKELMENLYSMKIAEEELAIAQYNRDRTYEKYEEEVAEREEENEDRAVGDLDKFDLEQADNEVEAKYINIAETKRNAKKSIRELYLDIRMQHNAMKQAEREITYAKQDFEALEKRYNAGVISRQEYEQAEINVIQAKSALEMEKYNYFLLTKQAELLENGVILGN
ncbi:TolC family protein [Oceanobacillus senegalensis]|uniref:TolC family protein n=1 Tax=Oceanobacillus senegalensis TaxID=1936063 RepID=UPI000A30F3CC|nr:TolC family protein [Oceanobacillus senegalensis]